MISLAKRRLRLIIETSETIRERGRYREIIMEAHPYHISVRLKGMRQNFDVSCASIYNLAVRQTVEKERAEKKARKAK